MPENKITYEKMFNLASDGKQLTDDILKSLNELTSKVPPVIGPTANILGCLEAFEAFKFLTGIGKLTIAPKMLSFDLLDLSSFKLQEI